MFNRGLLQRWLPVVLWAGVIFVLSSRPGSDFPQLGLPVQKAFHVGEYALLAGLVYRALIGSSRPAWRPTSVAWLLTVLYAVSDEVHQVFVSTRNGNPVDVGIDAFGAVIGIACARVILFVWFSQRDAAEQRFLPADRAPAAQQLEQREE